MTRKTYSAAKIRKAVALVRDKGYSYAAAGKTIGATRDTVKRWCDAEGVRSGAADALSQPDVSAAPLPTRRKPYAPAEPVPDDDSIEGALTGLRDLLRWTKEQADAAAKDGNIPQASKLNRDAVALAQRIAQTKAGVEKLRAESGGVVYSPEKLRQLRSTIIAREDALAASLEGSLGYCPRCGANVRAARASAPDAEKEV